MGVIARAARLRIRTWESATMYCKACANNHNVMPVMTSTQTSTCTRRCQTIHSRHPSLTQTCAASPGNTQIYSWYGQGKIKIKPNNTPILCRSRSSHRHPWLPWQHILIWNGKAKKKRSHPDQTRWQYQWIPLNTLEHVDTRLGTITSI